jgi:antitoxin VapB
MMTLPPEIEELARLVAAESGKTPEEVVREALEAHAREAGIVSTGKQTANKKPSAERMMAISERFAHHPVLDPRTPEEIIGYDDFGVPR